MIEQQMGAVLILSLLSLGLLSGFAFSSDHETSVFRYLAGSWALLALASLIRLLGFVFPGQYLAIGFPLSDFIVSSNAILQFGASASLVQGFVVWNRSVPSINYAANVRRPWEPVLFAALWGGTIIVILRTLQSRVEVDWVWRIIIAVWTLVPVGVALVITLGAHLRSEKNAFRRQSFLLFLATILGFFPDALATAGLSFFGLLSWQMGIPLFAVLGAVFTMRGLRRFDTAIETQEAAGFLLEKTHEIVVFINPDGCIHATNPALKALLDWDETEVRGKFLRTLSSSSEDMQSLQELESLSVSEWEGMLSLSKRNGESVPVRAVFRRIYNPAREVVGGILLFHDMRQPHSLDPLSREDLLTALSNRRWVLELLETEFQRIKRYGGNLTALWLDVDTLDFVNVTFGLNAGDEVLRRLGRILKESLRRSDFSGRIAGEEFLVVLPETPADKALVVAEKLRKNVAAAVFHTADEESFSVSVSIGVATADESVATTERFLLDVQKAMHEAKKLGKGKIWSSRAKVNSPS